MIWNEENDQDRTAEQIKQEWEQGPDQRTKNKVALLMFLLMIVAIPLFYWWHVFFYKKLANSISPEYKAWEKKYNERQDYLLKQFAKVENEAIQNILKQKNLSFSEKIQRISDVRSIDISLITNDVNSKDIKAKEPEKYQYPQGWKVSLYSVPATLLSAIVVFSIISAIFHGIRRAIFRIAKKSKEKEKKVNAEMQKNLQELKRKDLIFKKFKE